MQAHFRSFSLAKIVFITQLVNKKFPFMLPSHNCIIIDSMFSFQGTCVRVSPDLNLSRDSMKHWLSFLTHCFSQSLFGWWRVPGSNRWPPACKAGALPAELTPHLRFFLLLKWWAKMDSNHRPHDYQSCALASWAIGPYQLHFFFQVHLLLYPLNWITHPYQTLCTDL